MALQFYSAPAGAALLLRRLQFSPYAPSQPYSGPLALELTMTYPWRKSDPKNIRAEALKWKTTRPDGDNTTKLVIDALAPRFFVDDSHLCAIHIYKFWGSEPGIRLTIWQLPESGNVNLCKTSYDSLLCFTGPSWGILKTGLRR